MLVTSVTMAMWCSGVSGSHRRGSCSAGRPAAGCRGRLPRALHRPYWTRPTARGFRQNTDPWVFGERMIYSVCKQIVGPERSRTCMQDLPIGSVLCFGSTIDHEFCLDTVFVVASAQPWIPADVDDADVDDAFAVCTAGSIAAGCTDARARLTRYRGATVDDPVHGMYSFVPALPATDNGPRFARPALHLPGLINPASRQSPRGAKRPLPTSAIRDAWEAVRYQVLAADLTLTVHLDTPPEANGDSPLPATTRTRC